MHFTEEEKKIKTEAHEFILLWAPGRGYSHGIRIKNSAKINLFPLTIETGNWEGNYDMCQAGRIKVLTYFKFHVNPYMALDNK